MNSLISLPALRERARAPRYTLSAAVLAVAAILSGCDPNSNTTQNCTLDSRGDSSSLSSECIDDAVASAPPETQSSNLLTWFVMYHMLYGKGTASSALTENDRTAVLGSYARLSDEQRSGIRSAYSAMSPADTAELDQIWQDALKTSEGLASKKEKEDDQQRSWGGVHPLMFIGRSWYIPSSAYTESLRRPATASRFAHNYSMAHPAHIASTRATARARVSPSRGGFGSRGGGVGGGHGGGS